LPAFSLSLCPTSDGKSCPLSICEPDFLTVDNDWERHFVHYKPDFPISPVFCENEREILSGKILFIAIMVEGILKNSSVHKRL